MRYDRESGQGGMGEVYEAFDTDLDRRVAIKTLPEAFASDEQRLKRFIREAKAVSALNHPHIVTIHEIGTADGLHFIVTELVDGNVLRSHIRARHTLGETLQICLQIAGALDAAHQAGNRPP